MRVIGLLPVVTAIAGALLCFALRMVAIHRGWQLPRAKGSDDDAGEARDGGQGRNRTTDTRIFGPELVSARKLQVQIGGPLWHIPRRIVT